MRKLIKLGLVCGLVIGLSLALAPVLAQGDTGNTSVTGRVVDTQGQPVSGAKIEVVDGDERVLAETESQEDGALISMVIANIPFTAAMLPVFGFLTSTVPGAQNKSLFFGLSVGSVMGGNGSLIGASANVVTAGISERAGYPITFVHFVKVGFPAMLVTVAIGTGWLLIRFL